MAECLLEEGRSEVVVLVFRLRCWSPCPYVGGPGPIRYIGAEQKRWFVVSTPNITKTIQLPFFGKRRFPNSFSSVFTAG